MSLFSYGRGTLAGICAAGSAACGGGGTGPDPDPNAPLCTTPTPVVLEVGQHRILDAGRESNCVSLLAGASEREYLLVAISGAGNESSAGTSTPFALQGRSTSTTTPVVGSPLVQRADLPGTAAFAPQTPADFHKGLRLAEQSWARDPGRRLGMSRGVPLAAQGIPVFGGKDSFSVCRQIQCTGFTRVGATVRFVGRHGAIYVDDDLPAGAEALTQTDYDDLGRRFDDYIYPADTMAFGRESDINLDERIAILITDAVNDLTPNCSDGRIVGYFYGVDLLPGIAGSNRREVFYAFAPKPATAGCSGVTRARALTSLPPVLIHELQHMISFNQHVLVRGSADEDVWLNEALSHFAEELGHRTIPDAECPGSVSCFSQFASGNIGNAYDYLDNPEATHLVTPARAGGPLAERGAGWLFVRWALDHFATDTLLGTNMTRSLVQTARHGADNVTAVTGTDFPRLVAEWQLANYLENLSGFPQDGRLRYRSWNFRATFAANFPAVFPKRYPLTPDSTNGSYARSGTLRAGSGRHVRFMVGAGAPAVTVRLAASTGGNRLAESIESRIAVVRIK